MIGIFDSGVGGLSVLRAIREKAPRADVIYFGDTENAPYGTKSRREISHLIAMALRRLHALGCTDIVAACNSASVSVASIPIDLLRLNVFNVIEMVEPTIEGLKKLPHPVAIVGTQATKESGIYQNALKEAAVTGQVIAIPELAGLIEKGAPQEEIKPHIEKGVAEALSHGAKTLSLSCTHFPFVQGLFEDCLTETEVILFNPAEDVAAEATRRFGTDGTGALHFLMSRDSGVFRKYVADLCGDVHYTIAVAKPIYYALKTI